MMAINYPTAAVDTETIYELPTPVGFEREFIFPESEGDFVSSGNNEDAAIFQSVLDGDPVVRTFDNFHVQRGHRVRPSNRCKGFYLNILGDCIIEGRLTMTARGAKGQGRYIGIFPDMNRIYYATSNIYGTVPDSISRLIIGPVGGAGGICHTSNNIDRGSAGINNAGGGGGAGAHVHTYTPQGTSNGTAGTSFSGGSGGGGVMFDATNGTAPKAGQCCAAAYAGQGGSAYWSRGSYSISAGVGNPNGGRIGATTNQYFDTYCKTSPNQGTGGAIILIVHGKLIISDVLSSATEKAGIIANGISANTNVTSWPGGGSGGGIIHVFCYGEFTNGGEISVVGGNYAGAGSKTGWQKVNGVWQKLTV